MRARHPPGPQHGQAAAHRLTQLGCCRLHGCELADEGRDLEAAALVEGDHLVELAQELEGTLARLVLRRAWRTACSQRTHERRRASAFGDRAGTLDHRAVAAMDAVEIAQRADAAAFGGTDLVKGLDYDHGTTCAAAAAFRMGAKGVGADYTRVVEIGQYRYLAVRLGRPRVIFAGDPQHGHRPRRHRSWRRPLVHLV